MNLRTVSAISATAAIVETPSQPQRAALAAGFRAVRALCRAICAPLATDDYQKIAAPLYWERIDGRWHEFTLASLARVP